MKGMSEVEEVVVYVVDMPFLKHSRDAKRSWTRDNDEMAIVAYLTYEDVKKGYHCRDIKTPPISATVRGPRILSV